MRRGFFVALVFSLLAVSFLAQAVSASPGGSVLEKILPAKVVEILQGLFVDSTGDINDPNFILVMKVLFMLMLFALLFGVAKIVPGLSAFPNNIRLTITLLLSVISVLFIPTQVLVGVATTYGVVFFALLLGAPVVGGVYLIFSTFEKPTRENYIAKFLVAGILWYIIGTFEKLLYVAWGSDGDKTWVVVIVSISQIISFICGLLMLYYAWKSLFPGEEEDEEATENAKKAMRVVSRWWKTRHVGDLLDRAPKVFDRIDAAIAAHNVSDVRRAVGRANEIMKTVGELIGRAQSGVNDVDGPAQAQLQHHVDEMEGARDTLNGNLEGVLNRMAAAPVDWGRVATDASAARTQLNMLRSRAVSFAQLI